MRQARLLGRLRVHTTITIELILLWREQTQQGRLGEAPLLGGGEGGGGEGGGGEGAAQGEPFL